MQAVMVKVFDNAYLSNVTGYVDRANSHAVPVSAESVRINGTLIQLAGTNTPKLELQLEGSYDGQVWTVAGLSSALIQLTSPPGVKQSSALLAVDYAYVRLRATVSQTTGTDTKALFDAELVFSHQA